MYVCMYCRLCRIERYETALSSALVYIMPDLITTIGIATVPIYTLYIYIHTYHALNEQVDSGGALLVREDSSARIHKHPRMGG